MGAGRFKVQAFLLTLPINMVDPQTQCSLFAAQTQYVYYILLSPSMSLYNYKVLGSILSSISSLSSSSRLIIVKQIPDFVQFHVLQILF